MIKKRKFDSKELGLEIGLIIGKHIFHSEHLHYGYWTDDLNIDLFNLPQAQENYCKFLISQIPEGIKTILDVGCGVGKMAAKLIDMNYRVDCISPSAVFAEHTRHLLGSKSHIFECCFENLQTEDQYDMILFSESFQYVPLEKALQNAVQFLNDNGYLLICDFFKTDAVGECMLGGGHKLKQFYDTVSHYPLQSIRDLDITDKTSPNVDILNDILSNVGQPIWNLLIHYMNSNYYLISKFLHWKFKKKIDKINLKYFSGLKNSENFEIYKSYRFMLYRKKKA
jgi:SAM-dependent methyltransferase